MASTVMVVTAATVVTVDAVECDGKPKTAPSFLFMYSNLSCLI
jgi:hypothetical protein